MRILLRTEALEEKLARANMGKQEFARLCEISNEHLSRLIGNGKAPGPTTRAKFQEILRAEFDDLFLIEEDTSVSKK